MIIKLWKLKSKCIKTKKKINNDTVQRLQYEVITLKKEKDMNNNNIDAVIGQYKEQIYRLNNEINRIKKENLELSKYKDNNVISPNTLKDNINEDERNDEGELKPDQL